MDRPPRFGGRPQAWGQGQNPGGQQQGGPPGDSKKWGDEHDPNVMGPETNLDKKTKEQEVEGQLGNGNSRRETILTSAKKGFASTGYKRVYAEYKKVVEEVMTQEKVPQGYKYYVKRYFQRIKPHSMD